MGPGILNIQVRVAVANAQRALRGVRADMAALQAESKTMAAAPLVNKRAFSDLTKVGNQMQWTGRQLQYNFAVPLLLAGAAATKFALDQQTAMVHVKKVYGDTTQAAAYWSKNTQGWMKGATSATDQAGKVFNAELSALEKNFDALSVRYGVQKKEVMEVAGAWAAAGVSGKALAESVENTMIASAIGDFTPVKATEALIAIQAQYNMSATELKRTLADLNAIENATATDMTGLITSLAKAGSAAAASGTSARYLAAMTAAITPAAGSAAQAGNALKTILSKITRPTMAGADAMAQLGANTDSASWKALSGAEKLKLLSKGFNGLSRNQQLANATATVGIYQYNRYIQLLKDMGREHGHYQQALDATSSKEQSFNTLNKELSAILESNPKRLQRMGVALQNSLADIITPLIPYMIYLAQSVAGLVKAFDKLPAAVKKVALFLSLFLIFMPLILRYIGSFKTLIVAITFGFTHAAQALGLMTTATQVQTVVDGEAVVVTEMRRRGLVGLFVTMMKAPFILFGKMASAGFGLASKTFMFMYLNIYKYVSTLVAAVLPGLSLGIATMVSTWVAGAKASVGAAVAMFTGTTAAAAATVESQQALGVLRLGIEGATAEGTVAIWTASYAEQAAAMQAFNLFRLEMMRAYNAAMYGLEAGASASRLAITTGFTAAEVEVSAVGATAKVGIFSRLATALTALYLTLGARLKVIWAATIAFLTSPAAILAGLSSIASVIGTAVMGIVAAITSPFVLAAAAVIAVLFAFRNQIAQVWNNIVNYFKQSGDLTALFNWMVQGALAAFNALPQGIQNAMIAVVNVVKATALAVYGWFSYINPWAHHSPSLVENVRTGMAAVLSAFSSLSKVQQYVQGAYNVIKAFGKAVAGMVNAAAAASNAADRASIVKFGGANAGAEYDAMQAKLKSLGKTYTLMGTQIAAAESKLAVAQKARAAAAKEMAAAQREMAAAQRQLDSDMAASNAAIHANDIEQKKLQLQILQTTEVITDNGDAIDKAKSQIDALNGEQEILRGTQQDLRNAGAGSDVLAIYDQKINELEAKRSALEVIASQPDTGPTSNLDPLNAQLDALQKAGQILQLQQDITFDPQKQAIDAMQKGIDGMQLGLDGMDQGIDDQQDAIDAMKEKYDLVGDAIQAIKDQLQAATSAAQQLQSAIDAKKQAAKAKKGAKKGAGAGGMEGPSGKDFPDVTGAGLPSRSGKDWQSQVDEINKLTDQQIKDTAGLMSQLNPFKSLGGWFKKVWSNDVQPQVQKAGDWMSNFFAAAFKGVELPDSVKSASGGVAKMFDPKPIADGLKKTLDIVTKIFSLFWPDIERFWTEAFNGLKDGLGSIGKELSGFGDLFAPLGQTISAAFKILKPIIALIVLNFLLIGKVATDVVSRVIGPAFAAIGTIVGGVVQIIKGILEVVVGVVNAVLGVLTFNPKMVWDSVKLLVKGIGDIFGGLGQIIWGILKGAFQIVLGTVKGFVDGVFGFFKWLYNLLPGSVRNTIASVVGAFSFLGAIPGIIAAAFSGVWAAVQFLAGLAAWFWTNVLQPVVNLFVDFFQNILLPAISIGLQLIWLPFAVLIVLAEWIWTNVLQPVVDAFISVWTDYVGPELADWWNRIQAAWGVLMAAGKWMWDNVLNPVWLFFKSVWDDYIAPFMGRIWQGLQNEWAGLKNAAGWVWDNVLNPVYQKFKSVFDDYVYPFLKGVWGSIQTALNALLGLPKWIYDSVLDPMFQKFKDIFSTIGGWLKDNISKVTDPITSMVNKVIGAVNKMIDGLNALSKLPGISWHIDHIPGLAQGGAIPHRKVGAGFKTNGARAIVGEGKQNHPEYVIPTDPTHRRRALSLFAGLGTKLGVNGNRTPPVMENPRGMSAQGVPMFGIGGVLSGAIGTVKDLAKEGSEWVADHARDAASAIYSPFGHIVDGIIDKIDYQYIHDSAKAGHQGVKDWIKGADEYYSEVAKAQGGKWSKPLMGGYSIGGGINSYPGHNGQDFPTPSGSPVHAVNGGTVTISKDLTTSYGKHIKISHPDGIESLYAHNQQRLVNVGDHVAGGDVISYSDSTGNSTGPHLHLSMWNNGALVSPLSELSKHGIKMAKGAVVRATNGGTAARIGEGGHDEAVIPLPNGISDMTDLKGGNHYTFTGDLSFPNITSPDDAQKFIENLEAVVKD